MSYNTGSNFCDYLRVGQAVCCSSGNLPDPSPKQTPDGSCFDYVVQEDGWCDSISAFHDLTLDELKVFNENTWGFSGCESFSAGVKLCLSKGSPPLPVPVSNAVCGPQKPNTPVPSDRSPEKLAKLNPCPLEACCNNWGQCGTTKEFCEVLPRGSKVGPKSGCVSNSDEKEKSVTRERGLNVGGVFDRAVEGDDWRTMNCEHPAIKNTLQPAKTRWESIGADRAWKELVEAWEKGESRLNFMRLVAEFFNMDSENSCHLTPDEPRCVTYLCSDFENKERTGPATSIVVNALAQFMRNNCYNAVQSARDGLEQRTFEEAFSESKTDEAVVLPILNNLLSVGFTSGLASVFGNRRKGIPAGVTDNSKKITYAAITFGASTARDFIGSLSPDKKGNRVSAMIRAFYQQTALRMAETSKLMFNSDPGSIKFLYSLISEEENDTRIWKLEGVNLVVIMTDAKCDDVGVGTGLDGYIRPEHAELARGFLEDKLLYLLSPSSRAIDQTTAGGAWSPPPGLKSIKGGNWAGVKVEDMISSAAEWTLRHNSNRKEGVNDPAYKSKGNHDLMWDVIMKGESVMRTPGVVDIPACSEKTARRNWLLKANQRWYSWPCDK
ncbi:Killer toxin subunits alpha/beta 6 [Colletotrichum sojae]|uniref:Killer toxin subunits alpha/beta 6 n=1 Tax=Colletotrichum sojae TaxID=2175907 RepID=A0A8H6MTF7_9PEZI|nr:Killer toxin subunits alpha/beta 6 [Colletotrichum sojae]